MWKGFAAGATVVIISLLGIIAYQMHRQSLSPIDQLCSGLLTTEASENACRLDYYVNRG